MCSPTMSPASVIPFSSARREERLHGRAPYEASAVSTEAEAAATRRSLPYSPEAGSLPLDTMGVVDRIPCHGDCTHEVAQ
jgi:hypothetical protein